MCWNSSTPLRFIYPYTELLLVEIMLYRLSLYGYMDFNDEIIKISQFLEGEEFTYLPTYFYGLVRFKLQYIPRNMHTVFALPCFVVVIHWLIYPYPSGLLHWHCDNLTIAPVPAKQPWWIWINTSFEFIMNDYITTTKQSTTKPCAYFLGYTVFALLRQDLLLRIFSQKMPSTFSYLMQNTTLFFITHTSWQSIPI